MYHFYSIQTKCLTMCSITCFIEVQRDFTAFLFSGQEIILWNRRDWAIPAWSISGLLITSFSILSLAVLCSFRMWFQFYIVLWKSEWIYICLVLFFLLMMFLLDKKKNSSEMCICVVPEPAMKQHCAPFIWVQGGYLCNSGLSTGCRGATPTSAEPLSLPPPWPGCCQGRSSHFCPHSSLLSSILPLLQHVLPVAVLLGLAGPCTGAWWQLGPARISQRPRGHTATTKTWTRTPSAER